MVNKKEKPLKVYDASEKKVTSYLRKISVKIALIIGVIFFGCTALVTTLVVVVHTSNLRASGAEYEYLRGLAGDTAPFFDAGGTVQFSALDEEMRAINADYVCWIKVDGTNIDYPVVRGPDNETYLNTSFYGEPNIAGALFMDYRNTGDPIPHIIIYGHNLQAGGMFTDLRKFLDDQFLEDNNVITLTVNGHPVRFEIFSARMTDVDDPAYYLNFSTQRYFARFADRIGAPLIATQIITLSTCVSGGSNDLRLVVQGYRLWD